eukprot:4761463-Prymnesium_polylepis.1
MPITEGMVKWVVDDPRPRRLPASALGHCACTHRSRTPRSRPSSQKRSLIAASAARYVAIRWLWCVRHVSAS